MRHWLLALLALVALGACGSGGDGSDAADSERGDEREEPLDGKIDGDDQGEVSRAEPGHLSVEVGGDLDFRFEEDLDLRIVVIRHEEITAVRFLSVGIEDLQSLPDGAAFRVAFDLAGVFDGEGTYELPAVGASVADPNDPGAAVAAGVSKPFLIYSPGGQITASPDAATQIRSFENALKGCTVEVTEDDGGAGTLECAEVTDTDGQGRISLEMEWSTG